MKKHFLTILLLLSSQLIFSQNFRKGQKDVNLGVGVGFGYGLGLLASGEYGITDQIGVGLVTGVSRYNYGYGFGDNFGITYVPVGLRGSFHLGQILKEAGVGVDKLDPYIGVTGGAYFAFYNSEFNSFYGRNNFTPLFGGHVGARYQYKPKLGLYLEGGFPFSSGGVTFKF